jgi:hypothetical protein
MSKKYNYFIIEYGCEIVDANTKEEAIAPAKQRIQYLAVEVDEEKTCQVEDEYLLKKSRNMKKEHMKNKLKLPLSQKINRLKKGSARWANRTNQLLRQAE